ncbi:asparaginase [Agrobacterium rubi]|uniref:Asparaginase n=1 Tax=Agrobacterium rubi TaxID=28099 RepID=A0AAE7UQR2_9HYPH|nr:asparaginase [Agrobacterium rubi]NTE88126.1 asparaginase [Agrobacterium rubi]NTF03893.1 asparaginase [Agrobacterium rubi]NTF38220.1 asparaginase [Agrobacterium rubi]OCJ43717.1 L-asparaginase [Agrobacterium rubi]QTG01884.1 asparaginase [Agrobacterium rubi]
MTTTICLVTTGGTIASQMNATTGHVTAQIGGNDLRAALSGRLDGVDVVVDEFMTIGSFALTLQDAFALANRIKDHLANPKIDGVVVTHGTDTMEESAYMADLLINSEKPVVFTGAQRAADEPDADGPRNIADSVRIAASSVARGLGVLLCFEQEFHAARDVTKSHTSRTDTFISAEHGKLGEVDGDIVVLHRRPVIRDTIPTGRVETDIEIVKLGIGSSDRYLRFLTEQGVGAVVIEGFGRGNAPPAVTAAAIDLVTSGVPVVITSRCQRGRVKPIYGNGGGKTLAEGGVIFAGDLSSQKARILLSLLMGAKFSDAEMAQKIEYFSA